MTINAVGLNNHYFILSQFCESGVQAHLGRYFNSLGIGWCHSLSWFRWQVHGLKMLRLLHSQVWWPSLHLDSRASSQHGNLRVARLLPQQLIFKRKCINGWITKLQISLRSSLGITEHHFCHTLLVKTSHRSVEGDEKQTPTLTTEKWQRICGHLILP